MMERIVLEANGITKRFGDRDALRGVDMRVRAGEVHGLLGPNGAGKTTLLRVLLGLMRPDAGSIRLFGALRDSSGSLPPHVAGFVDVPAFYPYLSGRRNLDLLQRLDDVVAPRLGSRQAPQAAIEEVLDQVGLRVQAGDDVAGYSAGMRQRLGVAAALLRSPRLLLLDEPTNSLDPAGARLVRALARRRAEEGAAVLLSSHDLAEVEELCTVITVMNHGRVVFTGAVEDLRRLASAAVHVLTTSDDIAALELADRCHGLKVTPTADNGLQMAGDTAACDAFVVALGRAGIAVRALERRTRSLESLFFELTGDLDPGSSTTRVRSEHEPAAVPA
jgi:ABC-2 type transport system ATP-binding protein